MSTVAVEGPPRTLARWLRASAWLGALAVSMLAAWGLVVWLEGTGLIAAVRERGGLPGAAALVLFHAAVAVSPAPGEAVAVANSAIYGFGWGVLMNWTGWMLAAIVEFALVRGAIRSLAPGVPSRWVPVWLRRLPADHPLFLIAGRWVPFGGHVVNVSAAAKATFGRHVWCAGVGILPVAVLFSALANGWRLFW